MNDDVDGRVQQLADVAAFEAATAFGLFHEQGQLLERERATVGMDRGDRTGMPGVDVAQIREGRAVTQFLQQDAIRTHAQRGFEQFLRPDLGRPLPVFRVAQRDTVWLRHDEFGRILDGDDPLSDRDLCNQRL